MANKQKPTTSSTKAMDVTTSDKTKNVKPKSADEPKIVLNKQKPIRDIDVSTEDQEDALIGKTKIKITENMADNLKSPASSTKKLEPIDDKKNENPEGAKASDDLSDDNDQDRDENFVDKIADESDSDEKDQEKSDEKQETDPSEPDKEKEKEKPEQSTFDSKGEEKNSEDSGEEGIVNELAEQAADAKKQKQEEKQQEEKDQRINNLIEEKTYFVPIGQITHRRHTRLLVLLIVLVIIGGLFAVNLAVDGGYIDIGVEPVTDLIK